MRYRQAINKTELAFAIIPVMDGYERLHRAGVPHNMHAMLDHWSAYLLLATPVILVLRYFFSYTELAPSTLEYHALGRRRSIPYGEISKVIPPTPGRSSWTQNRITLEGIGMKPLKLALDNPTDFIDDLLKHAPQARVETPLFAPSGS